MKNKVNTEGVVVFIGVMALVLTFLLGLRLGLEWGPDNSSQEQVSDNSSQEQTQNVEDGKWQPYGIEYQDKETGVCYFAIKDDTEDIQAMSPRYNADGTLMVKETEDEN